MVLLAHDFQLRPYVASDAAAFAAAVRESIAELAPWMMWASANYTEQEALDWFALCDAGRANGTAYEFGIFRADGVSVVGGAGLNQLNKVNGISNLGYWVRRSAQRQGAASAAVSTLSMHAFTELQLSRVEIVVADGNAASLAVARKSGAVYECLARNRLRLHGAAVAAHVFSLIPAT